MGSDLQRLVISIIPNSDIVELLVSVIVNKSQFRLPQIDAKIVVHREHYIGLCLAKKMKRFSVVVEGWFDGVALRCS